MFRLSRDLHAAGHPAARGRNLLADTETEAFLNPVLDTRDQRA
jgi:hypothetical protein